MAINYSMLGEQVRRLRKKSGLSQEQLAEACDISTSFLGHIERGTRKMSLETLVVLAEALCVTPDTLLQGQLPVNEQTIGAFLSSLTFDSKEQRERFYCSVQALAKGRDML